MGGQPRSRQGRDDASGLGHRQAASAECVAARPRPTRNRARSRHRRHRRGALDVQTATGSAKPPGGVLHVLAIGVDKFGDKAGGLHLDYAAEDAHDVASALLESQKSAPGKASLYADVKVEYLPNEKAELPAILDALDAMAQAWRRANRIRTWRSFWFRATAR